MAWGGWPGALTCSGARLLCKLSERAGCCAPAGGSPVEVQAGDLATFPAGMSCTWDVKEAISKHYNFH